MKPLFAIITAISMLGLCACSSTAPSETAEAPSALPPGERPWTVLFDGTSLDNWTQVGQARWDLVDRVVTGYGEGGTGYLVSKESYSNFEIMVEFWVDKAPTAACSCAARTRITSPKIRRTK